MMYNNICLFSIIVNKYGVWKLVGFDFCVVNISQQDQVVRDIIYGCIYFKY